jgi:polysaccharide export outer membrane protein
MGAIIRNSLNPRAWLMAGICFLGAGCVLPPVAPPPPPGIPNELAKVTLPPYVIEPPDILIIEVFLPGGKDGRPAYDVPPQPLYPQPITGQHLVRPDGTVGLGVYGSVQLAGLTLDQARESIRGFVATQRGYKPSELLVIVDVAAYNSKMYYVITDGAGYGEQVYSFPITGSETVLDAISRVQGLPAVASKRHIWVARRHLGCGPNGPCPDQVLGVDWVGITQCGDSRTNHQLMPGDRVYVMSQPLIRGDNLLGKLLQPVERVLGVTLLGSQTVNSIRTGTVSGVR